VASSVEVGRLAEEGPDTLGAMVDEPLVKGAPDPLRPGGHRQGTGVG
jgi:hypothetical protein